MVDAPPRQSARISNMPIISMRATSLDVCECVYGDDVASFDAISKMYEMNAIRIKTYELSYENPFLTATSRSIIADIHKLSRQLSSIDVPRPLAMLSTLFQMKPYLEDGNAAPMFKALRIWTEINDVCESESFDGHRKSIVEHTLNILLLPGIHDECKSHGSADTLVSTAGSPTLHARHLYSHSLRLPGTSLSVPSPFHMTLHVITRLSFNEQGRITHHRDFWDVKDVIGLVPGVSLAQWIATRLAAIGLSYAVKLLFSGETRDNFSSRIPRGTDLEHGLSANASPLLPPSDVLGINSVST